MAYFKSIVTNSTNQPHFITAGEVHATALNNYLKPVGREERIVKHMTTTQVVNNMVICTTSVLCCEGEEY